MAGQVKVLVVAAVLLTLLPVWRSGGREHLTLWGFVLNHTIWGPPVEYVPEEDYKEELTRMPHVRAYLT